MKNHLETNNIFTYMDSYDIIKTNHNEEENYMDIYDYMYWGDYNARIKELARKADVTKITQRMQNVLFYFERNKYNPEIIDKLIKKYELRIKFGAGIEPYASLKMDTTSDEKLIEGIKEFLRFIKLQK